MPRFEYRLNDKAETYPILYFYESITDIEASMRFICDYFIKEGRTFLKTATHIEPEAFIVYVDELDPDQAEASNATNALPPQGIAVEVREYAVGAAHFPVVHQFGFDNQVSAFIYLLTDSVNLFGTVWEKTSTEIDEDRQAYIYYAQPQK